MNLFLVVPLTVAMLTACSSAPVQTTAPEQTIRIPFIWKDGQGTARLDLMDVDADFGYDFCLGFWDSVNARPVVPFACYKLVGKDAGLDEAGVHRVLSMRYEGYLIPGDIPIKRPHGDISY